MHLNATYHFNICGYAKMKCIPPDWVNPFSVGVAVQFWGMTPPCSNPPQCVDNAGSKVCCSAECELLGFGAPQFVMSNPANPQSGGLNITYKGVPSSDLDPMFCSYNPALGGNNLHSVVYSFQCNPSGTPGTFQVLTAFEGPECQYNLIFSSVHGCGTLVAAPGGNSTCPSPMPSAMPSSAPSNSPTTPGYGGGAAAGFFFGGIACALSIGAVVFWWTTRRKQPLSQQFSTSTALSSYHQAP